jgi:hypothetical protein
MLPTRPHAGEGQATERSDAAITGLAVTGIFCGEAVLWTLGS